MDMTSFLLGYKSGQNAGGGSGGGGGGTGGGGGAFEPGIYLKPDGAIAPNKYLQWRFELNGNIYVMYIPYAGRGNAKTIAKWENGAWVNVITNASLEGGVHSITQHNGKIHIYGGDFAQHYVWDGGNTITRLNDMPAKISNHAMASVSGTLYAYCNYDGGLYTWDEDTDTWTLEATIGSKYTYYYAEAINGELWFAQPNRKVYKYINGALVEMGMLPYSFATERNIIARNDNIYVYSYDGTGLHRIVKYDTKTNTATELGYMPNAAPNGEYSSLWNATDTIHLTTNVSLDATSSVMDFAVHIVEASE